jgi:hypothetical protein
MDETDEIIELDEFGEVVELNVTPPPLSRLEFEKETANRASRGEPPPLCQICGILLSWFLDPPRIRTRRRSITLGQPSTLESDGGDSLRWETQPQVVHLGTYEEAVASPCSQHTAILKYWRPCSKDGEQPMSRVAGADVSSGSVVDLAYRQYGVSLEQPIMKFGHDEVTLALADYPGMENPRGNIRVLDQQWVDLPVISRWIDDCSKLHGEECENPMKIMRVVPGLLVDVKRKCIVEGRESQRYMALSYRLGKAKPFRLRLRDLDQFGKHAILDDAQILERLPLTVRHAILLADQLGSDYLWTDVLCIVHDGPTILADQLNKMSAIYAGAATTIVATDGDGADGISGLKSISGPRDLNQAAFVIRDEHLIIQEPEEVEVTNANVEYNSRGWTYQEYIMSPRKLVFMNQRAHWQCQCHQRRESDSPRWYGTRCPGPSQFIRSGYPDLHQLSELLSYYNQRDLTYPGDALPAISGLLAVLSRGFEDGFLYGLPERFFDIGLGWRPRAYGLGDCSMETPLETACRRRRGSPLACDSPSTIAAASEMPSWSWTAWQGGFSFELLEVAQVTRCNLYEKHFCETSPITEWSTGREPSNCNRRRILSHWHADRKNVDHQQELLPKGWTRMEASAAFKYIRRYWHPSLSWRPFVYRHQSMATEEPTFWYYPFRMPEINESTPFRVPEQTRYLFCKTWKASVLLCDRRIRQGLWDDRLDMELWANDLGLREGKSRIGRMWLHNAEQFEEETDAVTGDDERVALIDVVAISRSSVTSHASTGDTRTWIFEDQINVLWVKCEQGIAYRVASGFVNEEDWKRLDLEEIDLVLG